MGDTIIALAIMLGPFILIILTLLLFVHLLHNSARKRYREQGMSEEEIEKMIRATDSVSYRNNSPKEMSYLESMRIRGNSDILNVSPEALILYENLTGKEMSYLDSVSIREDAKLFHLSDTAVVMKRYGGR